MAWSLERLCACRAVVSVGSIRSEGQREIDCAWLVDEKQIENRITVKAIHRCGNALSSLEISQTKTLSIPLRHVVLRCRQRGLEQSGSIIEISRANVVGSPLPSLPPLKASLPRSVSAYTVERFSRFGDRIALLDSVVVYVGS